MLTGFTEDEIFDIKEVLDLIDIEVNGFIDAMIIFL